MLPPKKDRVQIHFFDASYQQGFDDASRRAVLMSALSSDEIQAVGAFKFPKDQYESLCAHALKRKVLAPLCDGVPSELRFCRSENGKPLLVDYPQQHFNLSHSQGLVLLGVRTGQAIGVDIECIRESLHVNDLAERFFHTSEAQLLAAAPSRTIAHRQFYRLWVAKEAIIKAMGGALAHLLKEVVLVFTDRNQLQIRQLPSTFPDVQSWHLQELIPAENALAAVASPAPIEKLEFFDAKLP